ncbi:MAG TPA: DivIVA domain-containing protein, partial [Jatrophihabitans sp.]|nr:DivIVA domain-containing protein [Jatrophihabitans sp.]
QIAPSVRDEPPWELPEDQAMTPDDIDAVRLPVALRGYRFAETDLLLDRLAGELRARDAEIARLRGDVEAPVPPPFFGHGEPVARPGEGTDEQMAEMLAVDEALEDPEPDGAPSTGSVHSAGAGDWTAQAPPWAVGPAPLASASPAGPPPAGAPPAGPAPLSSPPSPAVDTQAEAGPEVMDGPAHRRQRRRGRK